MEADHGLEVFLREEARVNEKLIAKNIKFLEEVDVVDMTGLEALVRASAGLPGFCECDVKPATAELIRAALAARRTPELLGGSSCCGEPATPPRRPSASAESVRSPSSFEGMRSPSAGKHAALAAQAATPEAPRGARVRSTIAAGLASPPSRKALFAEPEEAGAAEEEARAEAARVAEEANAARSSAATHMQAAARRRAACTSVSQMRAAEVEAAAAQAAAAMAKRVEAAVRMQAAARRRAAGKYTCFILPAGFFDSPRTGDGEQAGEGAAAAVSGAEQISNAVGSSGSSVGVSPEGSAAPQGPAAISLPPAKEAVTASPDAKAEAAPARVSWADEVEGAEGVGGEGATATGFSGTEQISCGAHSSGGSNVGVSPAGSASQHERRPILLPPAQATTPVASDSVEVAAALAWQRASEADAAHRSLRICREVKTEAARVARVFRMEAAIKAAEKAAEVAKAAEAASAAADAEAAAIETALADLDPNSAAAEDVMAAAMEAMGRAEAAEADGEAAAAEAMANGEPETVGSWRRGCP